MQNATQRKNILGSLITNASYEDVLYQIFHIAKQHLSLYVCIANVHMVIEAVKNPVLKNIINNAFIATPDGKPLSVFMDLLYGTKQVRITGPELMADIIKHATREGLSLYFYGSTEDVISEMRKKIKSEHPELKLAGMYSPPFRKLSEAEDEVIVQEINDSGANIVFVGLGCPKQEYWMHEHQGKINALMLGVGAAFPFYTGQLQRAPKWMQDYSLEWFYRLLKEPKRLFGRYFFTNSLFLILIFFQWGQILLGKLKKLSL